MSENVPTETSPAAAFGVLADQTRIEILQTLAEAGETTVSFSDLRERVGTTDSGRFNYHLGKLVGQFVAKEDDGYRLMTAGQQVYSAILAGTYSGSTTFEPMEIEDICPHCEHALTVRYEDEHLTVACPECERIQVSYVFPPGAFEGRTSDELLATLHQRLHADISLARSGTCPLCWGPTEKALTVDTPQGHDEELLLVAVECTRCGEKLRASPGALLLSEPAVIALYDDHGLDLRDQSIWTLPWLSQNAVERLSSDPYRARIHVTVEDEQLRVTVEPDATVSAIERGPVD